MNNVKKRKKTNGEYNKIIENSLDRVANRLIKNECNKLHKKNVEAELKKRGLPQEASRYAIEHYNNVPQSVKKGKIYDECLEQAIKMGKLMK